jgi:hypothetical protein
MLARGMLFLPPRPAGSGKAMNKSLIVLVLLLGTATGVAVALPLDQVISKGIGATDDGLCARRLVAHGMAQNDADRCSDPLGGHLL